MMMRRFCHRGDKIMVKFSHGKTEQKFMQREENVMMKTLTRVISLICVLAMLACVFVGCKEGDDNEDPQGTQGTQGQTEATTQPNGEDLPFNYETGDLLDPTLNYNNTEFSVYTWKPQSVAEWVENLDDAATVIEEALYDHMGAAEERLNLRFGITEVAGRYAEMNDFIATLENYTTTGLTPDLVCQYSLAASIGMLKGLYDNLLTAENLDFDAPWWNDTLVEGNTVNNHLYYITGDISASVVYTMYGMVFNKELVSQYNIESPYQLVRDGNWTYSRFLELIKDTSTNPNHDHVYTGSGEDVMYGFALPKLAVDAFQTGFGITAVVKNSQGAWSLSSDYSGARSADIIDKLRTLAYENNDVFYDKNAASYPVFNDGNAIFSILVMQGVEAAIRDYQIKVGIVPIPKYDATQKGHYTRLGMTVSLFSVPVGADMAKSSAVLEALGSDGYRNVTPVVFEEVFRGRYADAPEDAEMYLLIRNGIVYDPGNHQNALSTFSAFRNCVNENKAWTTYFAGKINSYAAALKNINAMGA